MVGVLQRTALWRGSVSRHRAPCSFSPLSTETYVARRQRLFSTMPPHSILVIPAEDEWLASGSDILYPFQQSPVFYHLFGYAEPLRRALAPCTAAESSEATMTFACFLKPWGRSATATEVDGAVLLFAPSKTTEPGVMVWSAHEKDLNDLRSAAHLRPARKEQQSTPSEFMCGDFVYTNQLCQVAAPTLLRFMEAMVAIKCEEEKSAMERERERSTGSWTETRGPTRSQLRRWNPLPHVLVHMPLQLRFSGTPRLRMRYPLDCTSDNTTCSAAGSKQGFLVFDHPLEFLLSFIGAISCQQRSPLLPHRVLMSRYALEKGHGAFTQGAGSGSVMSLFSREAEARREGLPKLFPGLQLRYPRLDSRKSPAGSVLQLPNAPLHEAASLLWRYRSLKSPSQVLQHFRSAAATGFLFECLFQHAPHTTDEYELQCVAEAAVVRLRRLLGPEWGVGLSYIPVIASGRRSFYIHYTQNNVNLAEDGPGGVLSVRVDAGVTVDHVPTDCTRTFPLGVSSFTSLSASLSESYTALIRLQRQLLQFMRHGLSLSEMDVLHVHKTYEAVQSLCRGLGGSASEPFQLADVRRVFCAHRFGHPFGLDIHEEHPPLDTFPTAETTPQQSVAAPTSAGTKVFAAGMVYTVEPGLYFPDESHVKQVQPTTEWAALVECIPPALRGLGVQVEDDVLLLPPSSSSSTSPPSLVCEWSRLEYLYVAVQAMKEQHCFCSSLALWLDSADPTTLVSPLGLEAAMQRLVYQQRVAIEGFDAAEAQRSCDTKCTREACASAKPWCGADPCTEVSRSGVLFPVNDAWYPFDILVLTACVPKDSVLVERSMRRRPRMHCP